VTSGRRPPPPGFPEILAAADGVVSVLDVGCGSGRLAVELVRSGAAVTGIDVSEARLAAAGSAPVRRESTSAFCTPT